MGKFYRFEKLVLLDKMTFLQKIVSWIFNLIGYSFGYISCFPWIFVSGFSVSKKIFRVQSTSYLENGVKIYRRSDCGGTLASQFKGMKTITEIFKNLVEKNPNSPCLGFRKINKENSSTVNGKDIIKLELLPFEWLTTNQTFHRVISLSVFLNSIGIDRDSKILLFAETSQDWLIMALSAMMLRAPGVTVYPTLTDESIIHCLKLTEPKALLVDQKTSCRLEELLKEFPSITTIIYSSRCPKNIVDGFTDGIKRIHVNSIYNDAYFCNKQIFSTFVDPMPDDLVFIMFTSGSTGLPKGVMIRHSNIMAVIAGTVCQEKVWYGHTYCAYLHLSHILELCCEISILAYNGRIAYCSPNTLFSSGTMLATGCPSDLQSSNPTCMAIVPIISERIKENVLDKLSSASGLKKVIFQCSYNLKAHFLGRGIDTPVLNLLIFNKFKQFFGGKINFAISGGALLAKETEEFLNICFFPFKQAYGATEICCGATMSNIDYRRPYNVGPVYGTSEVKVIPWEEGGYFMKTGKSIKGELAVAGPCVCSGYYKNESQTAENFILDKNTNKLWYHTSDIVKLLDDGTFRIIGRKSEVVKLSHGEYVELSKIENIISTSKYVDFVCVCTNKDFSQLISILCINRDSIQQFIKNTTVGNQETELYTESIITESIRQTIIEDINKLIVKAKLNKYETPNNYIIVDDQWLPDSGLITPTLKVDRIKVTRKYHLELQQY